MLVSILYAQTLHLSKHNLVSENVWKELTLVP